MREILLIGGLVCMPHVAHASGFYLTDVGTRGMGRAGAFVAAPDSVLAMHYNPAGLSYLKGFHFESSLTLVNKNATFERRCPCARPGLLDAAELDAEVEARYAGTRAESNDTLEIPFIGFAYGTDWNDTTFGVAVWGPNSGHHLYGQQRRAIDSQFVSSADQFPGRYSATRAETFEVNLAIAMAMQPFSGFRIGLELIGYQSGNDKDLNLWVDSTALDPNGLEDAQLDAPTRFEFRERLGLNWAVGASYEPIPGLIVGTSFRAPRTFSTTGTLDIQIPLSFFDDEGMAIAEQRGNEVDVSLGTAGIWRMGVQYGLPKIFNAEAAVIWEGWSIHDSVTIEPTGLDFLVFGQPQELGTIDATRGWQDTWSVRVGGEMLIYEPELTVQAGYFYEPTAIPETRVDPSFVDLDKHGAALGLSTTWYGITLDVSFLYVAMVSTEVRNSQVIMTAPLGNAPRFITTVGNGNYTGRYLAGSASLRLSLEALAAALEEG